MRQSRAGVLTFVGEYEPFSGIDCSYFDELYGFERKSHFVHAETGMEIGQMYKITELIHAICNIDHKHFQMEFDVSSMSYYRFLTHVRFFAQRLMLGTYYEDGDSELLDEVRSKYSEAYACTRKISDYI